MTIANRIKNAMQLVDSGVTYGKINNYSWKAVWVNFAGACDRKNATHLKYWVAGIPSIMQAK